MNFLNFFSSKIIFFFSRFFETLNLIDFTHRNIIYRVLSMFLVMLFFNFLITINISNFNNLYSCYNIVLSSLDFNLQYFYPNNNTFYEQVILYFKTKLTHTSLINYETWSENEELIILIILVSENFFSYEDYLLILSELNGLETLLNFQFYVEVKLKKIFFNNDTEAIINEYLKLKKLFDSDLYFKNFNSLGKSTFGPKYVANSNLENDELIVKNFAKNFVIHKEFYSNEENIFKQFVYNFFLNFKNELDMINWIIIKILTDEFRVDLFKSFIISQLLLLDLTILFLKKKILFFFFFNLIIFVLMIWNLIRLCTAINLIFSLLHFLFFAVLSGLLIIFWGATYIGFSVLLIYGAAIPVLALYIIMLVNVDLIQRLFFVEHIANKNFYFRFKKFLFLLFFLLLLVLSTLNYENLFLTANTTFNNLYWTVFYFLLAKWYFTTTNLTYSVNSNYDLPLAFYSSDLDKVASAAYKISYNELIALVFLLLIAIIVVISISRTSKKLDKDFYEISNTNTDIFLKFIDFKMKNNFSQTVRSWLTHKFLMNQNLKNFYANYLNSEEFIIYKPYRDVKITDVGTGKQKDIRYFMVSPYSEWYDLYGHRRFSRFLFKNDAFLHPLPYGTQNSHPDDYFFWVVHYGLVN